MAISALDRSFSAAVVKLTSDRRYVLGSASRWSLFTAPKARRGHTAVR